MDMQDPRIVVTGNPVAGWPQIDANTCVVADPAFPERRNRPMPAWRARLAYCDTARLHVPL